jgi:hypothetical protein
MAFFDNVHAVITAAAEAMVKPGDALLNVRIIEAARTSNSQQRIIQL